MATKTVLELPLTGSDDRNALVAVQGRLEGVLTTGEPLSIERTGTSLRLEFPDTVPDEQVRACLRTLANLADRPGSGVGRGYTFTLSYDLQADALQREFSR